MNIGEKGDTTIYKVVVNQEEQYSIWPNNKENPLGWRDAGKTGLKGECLTFIKDVWTDMRPLTLRKRMEETSREENDAQADYHTDTCIHHLFEAQADHTPDAVAVTFEDHQLTYRELNCMANQLARHLQKLDVAPEAKVGLSVERSEDMLLGVLGILKAGGVYVPLDPVYPTQRLATILQDAQISVLLTQERLLGKFPECKAHVICLDRDWHSISEQSEENVTNRASAATLSHVIYTSGSIGMPKGVMVTHGSLYHNVCDIRVLLDVTSDDVYLHTASLAFTSSLRQLFVPLSLGAMVVITTPEQRTNPLALFDLIKRRGVTIFDTVASFWETCTSALARLKPESRNALLENKLRLILSSGGELPSNVPKNWRSEFNHGASLVNMYGQTETIGNILVYPIPEKDNDKLRVVPLGPPITNTQVYLLDEHFQPVADGVPAELHIGGLSMARGYLNLFELTAEKFIPNPFSSEPGARLYRAGEMGRSLPNGTIEFMGRIDFQINIRGFRIEPGEIEAVLKQHPSVLETVVMALEDGGDDKRLVAYVVSNPENVPTIGELRNLLIEKLPEYMVPSAFVMLDALPRMPNGKINRHALPAPGQKRPDLGQPYVPPRNELHRYLANLWCDILKLDTVGIHDRFFELGGTSLQAARVVNKLQNELGEFIYTISIFEAPSIAEYAEFLKNHYAQAVAKRFPHDISPDTRIQAKKVEGKLRTKVSSSTIKQMRQFIPSRPPNKSEGAKEPKNPSVIFILAPPRSGTVLLSIMLAEHPGLLCANELQLLGFNDLLERKAAFTGKYRLWLEGTIRAIIEIKRCDVNEAKNIMKEYEDRAYTTKGFYRVLQEWIGKRTLVDNSTTYAFHIETLEKAEQDFHNARYIHFVSHPNSMIRSFESYGMAQALYLDHHPFSARELGELLWTISHKNISNFLEGIPAHRKFRIRFEDLMTQPQEVTANMCQTLGLEFHPGLLNPYRDTDKKISDRISNDSRPMSDGNRGEDERGSNLVTGSRSQIFMDDFLGDITWEVAEALGYERPIFQREYGILGHNTVRATTLSSRREFTERQRQLRLQHRGPKK